MQLHAQKTHINRVLDHNSREVSLLFLSDAEHTTECLLFNTMVPPKIKRNTVIGPWKVETVNLNELSESREFMGPN
jgi:hypothetical protein